MYAVHEYVLIKESQSVELYRVKHPLGWVNHWCAFFLVRFLCIFVFFIGGVIGYELFCVLLFWLRLSFRDLPCQYTVLEIFHVSTHTQCILFNACRELCYVEIPWLIYPVSWWGIFGLPQHRRCCSDYLHTHLCVWVPGVPWDRFLKVELLPASIF